MRYRLCIKSAALALVALAVAADAFAGPATDQLKPLLERAILGKIEQYGTESVAYGEESPDGDDTIVPTRVTLRPSWAVDVDYRMAWQGTR